MPYPAGKTERAERNQRQGGRDEGVRRLDDDPSEERGRNRRPARQDQADQSAGCLRHEERRQRLCLA